MPQPQPVPPFARDTGLPWDVAVEDAVAAIAVARQRHGDTFAVASGGDNYLFTFSPTGIESFYALPEDQASMGVADYLMLRRKLPDEIFAGRRTLPGTLFPVVEHLGGAGARHVGSGSVDRAPVGRRVRPGHSPAGHRIRARPPLLPGGRSRWQR
ncbi:hypothetical protein BH09ACT7_BH09ACT7_05400 [soil metagenome]